MLGRNPKQKEKIEREKGERKERAMKYLARTSQSAKFTQVNEGKELSQPTQIIPQKLHKVLRSSTLPNPHA